MEWLNLTLESVLAAILVILQQRKQNIKKTDTFRVYFDKIMFVDLPLGNVISYRFRQNSTPHLVELYLRMYKEMS